MNTRDRKPLLGLFGLVPLLLSGLPAAAQPAPEWRLYGMVKGLRVEEREVPGSAFNEIRISASRTETVSRLCDAIFARNVGNKVDGSFKERVVLRETPSERWTYERIKVPIVEDRDYVIHVKLDQPAASGRCEVSFQTEEDPARPPVHGAVRIKSIRGNWVVLPSSDGKVSVVYRVFSDPGGSIPAFFVRGAQRDTAVDFFKTILARAEGTVEVSR